MLFYNIFDSINGCIIRSLVSKYGRHYSLYRLWYLYPQACSFIHLKHRLHSHVEKSLIERIIQYFKDRTESFDDYYPCIDKKEKNCDLEHIYNWIKVFIYLYNAKIRNTILFKIGGEVVLS